ncbi:MAG: YigZ family protein [Oscillospiraceae bacterium]
MPDYKTVKTAGKDEFVVKKSKFIGHCCPISTEEAALEFIRNTKTKYWDASHNVYAYNLCKSGIMRYSDDGEPQGTAGIPVLDVLKKSEIQDAVIVVTRYFGGTLLGGGGLVRAYSHSASIAIAAAQPVAMRQCKQLSLRCEYTHYAKIQEMILFALGEIDDTVFEDGVTILFHMLPDKIPEFTRKIADITAGLGKIQSLADKYYEFRLNGFAK